MKKFKLGLLVLGLIIPFLLFAETTKEDDGVLMLKTKDNIFFENGFGSVRAKPVLTDKELEKKVTLIGEYTVDSKTNNTRINFDKIDIEGKIYTLQSSFYKKAKLRNPDAVLERDSNLEVKGGSKKEILDIFNGVEIKKKRESTSNKNTTGSDTINLSGTEDSSNNDMLPSSNVDLSSDDDDDDDESIITPTTNADTTTSVISCPKGKYENGLATYYYVLGNGCVEQTTNSVETQYNNQSCLNQVDYENNTVKLGFELFANSADGGTYLIQTCQYKDEIPLSSELSNCDVIPDYENNKAELQKRFYYNHENEKVNVGECTPTSEYVNLQYTLNDCTNDRHDFERNVSVAQGQYFYSYENKNYDLGQCVDVPQYTYNHYLDDSTCDYDISEQTGVVFYRERVSYDDLIGVKKYATDCQVTDSGGLTIQEEFAGYSYHPETRQAIRKINTFFITPTTKKKIFIDQNISTSKSYQYIDTQCKIVNDDTARTTTIHNETYFDDSDEGERIIISPCSPQSTVGYTTLSGSDNAQFVATLGFKQLTKKSNNDYQVLNEADKIIDHANGLFPSDKSGTQDITSYTTKTISATPCFNAISWTYGSGKKSTPAGGTVSTSSIRYKAYGTEMDDGCGASLTWRYMYYTKYTFNRYQYWEEIAEYAVEATYLRGDGTTLEMEAQKLYRIIR